MTALKWLAVSRAATVFASVACCVPLALACSGSNSPAGVADGGGVADEGGADVSLDSNDSEDADAQGLKDPLLDVDATTTNETGAEAGAESGVVDGTMEPAPADSSVDAEVDATSDADVIDATGEAGPVDAPSEIGSPDVGTLPVCAPVCPAGTKSCFGQCVSTNDPRFSCGVANDSLDVAYLCGPCKIANAIPGCAGGACAIASCTSGFGDCNNASSDGCETDLTTTGNCGACGHACGPGQVCNQGTCASACPFPTTSCSGSCQNLSTSSLHCGSCGVSCTTTDANEVRPTCSAGTCGTSSTCVAGLVYCPYGSCADTNDDPNACGPACTSCPGGMFASCNGGVCGITCPPGWTPCGTTCDYTPTSVTNCGQCGVACGADEVCSGGACVGVNLLVNGAATGVLPATGTTVAMATNGQDVSFGCATGVCTVPAQGGSVVALPSMTTTPSAIAMDSQYTYWAASTAGGILRTLTNGQGSPTLITQAVQPYAVYVDATYVYFLDQNGLWLVAKSGGTATSIPSGLTNQAGGLLFGAGSYLYSETSVTGGDQFLMQVTPPQTVTLLDEKPAPGWAGAFGAGSGMIFFSHFAGAGIGSIGLFDPATDSVVAYGEQSFGLQAGVGVVLQAAPASCGMVVSATDRLWTVPLQSWTQYQLAVPIMNSGSYDAGMQGTPVFVSDGTFLYVADTSNSNIYRVAAP